MSCVGAYVVCQGPCPVLGPGLEGAPQRRSVPATSSLDFQPRCGETAGAMANITLKVNGATRVVDVEPSTPLLYVLRNDLDMHGPRFGCGLGQCGACTVLIKGEAVRSCIRPVSAAQNVEITTLEGLATEGKLHPLQQAWIDEQVPQCGFCQNGQILTAKALLDRNPNPTDAEIRQGMNGALCRCMTYYRVQAAIKRAAKVMA
jgi:aerobic-type carbon monoxide dehydrogenase small subunit (CoxS/CutS family)